MAFMAILHVLLDLSATAGFFCSANWFATYYTPVLPSGGPYSNTAEALQVLRILNTRWSSFFGISFSFVAVVVRLHRRSFESVVYVVIFGSRSRVDDELREQMKEEHRATVARLEQEKEDIKMSLDREKADIKAISEKEKADIRASLEKEKADTRASVEKEKADIRANLEQERESAEASLKQEMEKNKEALDEAEEKRRALQRDLESVSKELTATKSEVGNLQAFNRNHSQDTGLVSTISSTAVQVRDLQQQVWTKDTEIKELQNELDRLKHQLEDANEKVRVLDELRRQKEDLGARLKDIQKECGEKDKRLETKTQEANEDYRAFEQERLRLEQQLSERASERDSLNEQVSRLDQLYERALSSFCRPYNNRKMLSFLRIVDAELPSERGPGTPSTRNDGYSLKVNPRNNVTMSELGQPDRVFDFDYVFDSKAKTTDIVLALQYLFQAAGTNRNVHSLITTDGYSGSGKSSTLFANANYSTIALEAGSHLIKESLKAISVSVEEIPVVSGSSEPIEEMAEEIVRKYGIGIVDVKPKDKSKRLYLVASRDALRAVLLHVESKRSKTKTNVNKNSSRSHIMIIIAREDNWGSITLLDVCGGESMNETVESQETAGINKDRSHIRNFLSHWNVGQIYRPNQCKLVSAVIPIRDKIDKAIQLGRDVGGPLCVEISHVNTHHTTQSTKDTLNHGAKIKNGEA